MASRSLPRNSLPGPFSVHPLPSARPFPFFPFRSRRLSPPLPSPPLPTALFPLFPGSTRVGVLGPWRDLARFSARSLPFNSDSSVSVLRAPSPSSPPHSFRVSHGNSGRGERLVAATRKPRARIAVSQAASSRPTPERNPKASRFVSSQPRRLAMDWYSIGSRRPRRLL